MTTIICKPMTEEAALLINDKWFNNQANLHSTPAEMQQHLVGYLSVVIGTQILYINAASTTNDIIAIHNLWAEQNQKVKRMVIEYLSPVDERKGHNIDDEV